MIAVDYTHRISPALLIAHNVSEVFRYLSYPSSLGKVIGQEEYDELRAAQIRVNLNWEWDSHDWLGGALQGAAHGEEAGRQASRLGYPRGDIIYGSCDFDVVNPGVQISGYASAFRNAVLHSGFNAGVYGASNVLEWCADNGFVGFWQSMSAGFDGNRNRVRSVWADYWQRGHMSIGGQDVDYSEIIQSVTRGADVDLNAIGEIVPGVTNGQVLRDIWEWCATARGLYPVDPQGFPLPRSDDRFQDSTFQRTVLRHPDAVVDVEALAKALAPLLPHHIVGDVS